MYKSHLLTDTSTSI